MGENPPELAYHTLNYPIGLTFTCRAGPERRVAERRVPVRRAPVTGLARSAGMVLHYPDLPICPPLEQVHLGLTGRAEFHAKVFAVCQEIATHVVCSTEKCS